MIDLQDRLRRASELVSPSEPAYERLLRRRERHARNQRLVSAAFALSLAAVVLVGVFAALGRLGSTERNGDRSGPVGRDTPEGLALGPDKYFYEKTTRILPDAPGPEGGTVVVETWWSSDGSGRKEAESTTSSYSPGPTGTWGPGEFPVMERDLAELSTAPDELAIQLRARSAPGGASPQPTVTPGPGQGPESGGLWRAISDLLEMPNAVPELRAALFRVATGIPGVRLVDAASDPAGRQAVTLEFRSEGADRKLFFDPDTLQFMAKVENYGGHGTSYLIVDHAGFVDSIDERPEGRQLLIELPGTNLPPACYDVGLSDQPPGPNPPPTPAGAVPSFEPPRVVSAEIPVPLDVTVRDFATTWVPTPCGPQLVTVVELSNGQTANVHPGAVSAEIAAPGKLIVRF